MRTMLWLIDHMQLFDLHHRIATDAFHNYVYGRVKLSISSETNGSLSLNPKIHSSGSEYLMAYRKR